MINPEVTDDTLLALVCMSYTAHIISIRDVGYLGKKISYLRRNDEKKLCRFEKAKLQSINIVQQALTRLFMVWVERSSAGFLRLFQGLRPSRYASSQLREGRHHWNFLSTR